VIELIIIATLSVLSILLLALNAVSKIRHKKSLELVAQALIDRSAMLEEIERLNFIVDNSSDLNDGFIGFLSQSREEAFAYISEVQSVIESLKMAMELEDSIMIDTSYKKLISFLPSDDQDVVN
jgi:biopolymer transport protein ExbB/TolQ